MQAFRTVQICHFKEPKFLRCMHPSSTSPCPEFSRKARSRKPGIGKPTKQPVSGLLQNQLPCTHSDPAPMLGLVLQKTGGVTLSLCGVSGPAKYQDRRFIPLTHPACMPMITMQSFPRKSALLLAAFATIHSPSPTTKKNVGFCCQRGHALPAVSVSCMPKSFYPS